MTRSHPLPRLGASLVLVGALAAACGSGAASTAPSSAPSVGPSIAPSAGAPSPAASASTAPAPSASPAGSVGGVVSGETIEITATDAEFQGVPADVPVGTAFTLRNAGTRAHQLVVIRRNDTATEAQTFDDLAAVPPADLLTFATVVGVLNAAPGQAADGQIVLDQPGQYAAVDLLAMGTVDVPASFDPAALPTGLSNLTRGMVEVFTVGGTQASPWASAPASPAAS